MATNGVSLNISPREKKAGAVRQAGHIPAVLYGHGVESRSIQVDALAFQRAFDEAGATTLVKLTEGDNEYNVLIRDIQLHPLRSTVTHVDFYQVRLDEEVEADVPLTIMGESPAVKNMGGIVVRSLDTIQVRALPQNLPHDIPVDISVLAELEQAIHISDLSIPAKVEVLDEPETVVVLIQAPRSAEELEALSEDVTEDVDKVEGVKEEEKAEGEEGEPADTQSEEKK